MLRGLHPCTDAAGATSASLSRVLQCRITLARAFKVDVQALIPLHTLAALLASNPQVGVHPLSGSH